MVLIKCDDCGNKYGYELCGTVYSGAKEKEEAHCPYCGKIGYSIMTSKYIKVYKISESDKQKEENKLNDNLKKIEKNIVQGYADHPTRIIPKTAIPIANDFKYVALKIYENNLSNVSSKNKLLNPFVMNGIFSIEVYLKIILKSLNADKISGHDLEKLFDEIGNLDKDVCDVLVKKYKSETSNNLGKFMKKYKNAFEQWRYSYEGYNQDGTIDCGKVLLNFNPDEIMTVIFLLSDYCNKNCKGVSFCD